MNDIKNHIKNTEFSLISLLYRLDLEGISLNTIEFFTMKIFFNDVNYLITEESLGNAKGCILPYAVANCCRYLKGDCVSDNFKELLDQSKEKAEDALKKNPTYIEIVERYKKNLMDSLENPELKEILNNLKFLAL